jgi:hypothetical protein
MVLKIEEPSSNSGTKIPNEQPIAGLGLTDTIAQLYTQNLHGTALSLFKTQLAMYSKAACREQCRAIPQEETAENRAQHEAHCDATEASFYTTEHIKSTVQFMFTSLCLC